MESTTLLPKSYETTKFQATSILICLLVLQVFNWADKMVISIVLQQLKVSLSLTDTQLGIIQTVFSVAVGLLAIPAGLFLDRWSRRKVTAIMAILWSAATTATGLATGFGSLLIARAAVGMGEAGFPTAGAGWLGVAFGKEHRTWVTGLFGMATSVGVAIGLIFGGMLLKATGMWQTPFFVFGVVGLIFGIWAFFLKDFKSPRKEGEPLVNVAYFKGWIELFKIKSFVMTTVGQILWGFMYFTYLGWAPAFLMRAYGIDAALAGKIIGGVALVGIPAALVFSILGHAWYKRNKNARLYMMMISQLGFSISMFLIIFFMGSMSLSRLIVIMVVNSFFAGWVGTCIYSLVQDVSPITHRFSSYGILATIVYVIDAIGPTIVGGISDVAGGGFAGLRIAFLWLMPLAFLAVVAYLINWKYYPNDSANVSDAVLAEK